MQETQRYLRPNPLEKASLPSMATWWWVRDIFRIGNKKDLDLDDLYEVMDVDKSATVTEKLQREQSLLVIQPLLLGGLLRYFRHNSDVGMQEAYLYAMGVGLCAIGLTFVHHPYFFLGNRLGMWMRLSACSLMYKKALRLSNHTLTKVSAGHIINRMTNDVVRFDLCPLFIHFLWIGPLQILAVMAILWVKLGPSSLCGFALLFLLVPLQFFFSRLFSILRRKTAIHTDERVSVMSEILNGVRIIKMYCWEKPFGDLVDNVRNFILDGRSLTTELVFVTIALYNPVRLVITLYWAWGVSLLSEARVSTSRIQEFLLMEEKEDSNPSLIQPKDRPPPAECKEANSLPTLNNLSFDVSAGELMVVVGPVAAGKSSLLMALLGELPLTEGKVKVNGKVAYASQQPWIFSASIRQNIVFGAEFDAKRYEMALQASALKRDLEILEHGDRTLVGDRGVSLSGGQKARVALARAIYFDADIYLLDDPLSAVDTSVGKHIMEKCICGALSEKPRILVTHQIQYLARADKILVLKDGEVVNVGTYEELTAQGIDFESLMEEPEAGEEPKEDHMPEIMLPHSIEAQSVENMSLRPIGSTMTIDTIGSEVKAEYVAPVQNEEQSKKGSLSWKLYLQYFRTGVGIFGLMIFVLLNLSAHVAYILCDWWLAIWARQSEEHLFVIEQQRILTEQGGNTSSNVTSNPIPRLDNQYNLGIFAAITLTCTFLGVLRSLDVFHILVTASRNIHNEMFACIIRCPSRFFDVNPVGRILNRFSKDIGLLDDQLPITMYDFIQCLLTVLGVVLVTCIVNPWVFIAVLPLGVVFFLLRRYYLNTSRDIKRVEGATRSPVLSHLTSTVHGLHTVRAYGVQETFEQEFYRHQDLHTSAWFLFLASARWFGFQLDLLCAFFITAVAMTSVVSAKVLDGGLVGLSVSSALTLMGMFQWAVRQSAEVENLMTSVERVKEYCQLESEAPLESAEDKKPSDSWPQEGVLEAENLSLHYDKESPAVLKNLNFKINAQEKVGIVGRTGAGKSSLIGILFRMTEPEGTLRIDGLDIQGIGLHDLRSKISMIPQDPMLFNGTVRKNLDPFSQHPDEMLWQALGEVQLKVAVKDLAHGLDSLVSEGGVNFSVGQRQLLCLARAILVHNRILVIDEATANVDPRTDALIQETIRVKFRQCTVLTVAHRLHTIVDSDRVLVLSHGEILEFDEPAVLLSNTTSAFYKMAAQTGETELTRLIEIADSAQERKLELRTEDTDNSFDSVPMKDGNPLA
ncbi:hypothetical protein CAPTEDRAFT_212470 [Capitella teleta]|uniref:Uncharacterized protein n=1 Tax=Capitella teleta TaxID=283909 RepID=R7TZG5_CAPTE|nr:hypothetical protein CAPTEDRAFT_212470 [Capitella teleta]|eukprot:ELT99037.1 hypothetical protein CAPTEDRAFT_212470 [Capitella teleta]